MSSPYDSDISTVFSIVPYRIHEFKPGLFPGNFVIEPCLDENEPQRCPVGVSHHIMEVGNGRPVHIVQPSVLVAKAIVDDFLNGQLWATPEQCPGICWLHGDISVKTFVTDHAAMHAAMKVTQRNWFVKLIAKTDDDWARYQNSRVVSAQARFAAQALGLTPAWFNTEVVGLTYLKCPACGISNPPGVAVCSNCRCVLDETKFKTLKFA